MHGFAYVVVATEREREIAHPAADMSPRQIPANPLHSPDEINGIVVMLLNSCRNGKDIGVEYYVERIHPHLFGEQFVSPSGYFYPPFKTCRLSFLVETHHHHGRTVAHDIAGMTQEHFFALFQRYGIDDALALHTLQTCCDHLPFRRVYHHRHFRNIRFCGYDVEESRHFLACIEQAVVHINVYHQRSVGNLFPCYAHRLIVAFLLDKAQELARTSHIATLSNIDKAHIRRHIKQFQATEPHR